MRARPPRAPRRCSRLTDRPYGDREVDVRDPLGNHWYIGTRKQDGPVPAGLRTITPTLHVPGTDRLIDFIQRAFGAQEVRHPHGRRPTAP